MVFGVLFGIPLLTLGWIIIYGGINQYRSKMLIEDTPTSTARAISMGRVEVQGSSEPVDVPHEAPFSKDDCVFYRYHVDKYDQDEDGSEGTWLPVEIGTKPSRFYVNDGTGRVMVDPADAELDVRKQTWEVQAGETEPEAVQSFIEERADRFDNEEDLPGYYSTVPMYLGDEEVRQVGDFSLANGAAEIIGNESRTRRYVEESLPVGEAVYVYGYARPREGVSSPDNPENVVIENHDDLPTYWVSTASEEGLVAETGRSIWKMLVAGALIAGLGFLLFLMSLGAVAGAILFLFLSPLSLGLGWLLNQFTDLGKTRMK